MKNIGRTGIKVGILLVALQDNGMGAVTPALASISQAFPDAGMQLISMLATIPALMLAIMPMLYPAITGFLRKKKILVIASVLFLVGGVGPAVFTQSLWVILFFRLLLGIACGTIIPLASDLVVDFFEGAERNTMLGWTSAATGFSGVMFQTLGGWLAEINWNYCFLAYLVSIIFLSIPIIILPEPKRAIEKNAMKNTSAQGKVRGGVWAIGLFLCLYWLVAYIVITNASNVLLMEGIATQGQIGLIFSCMTGGTIIASVMVGWLIKKMDFLFLPISMIFGAASLFIASQAHTILMFVIALFLLGFGTGLMTPGTVAKNTSLVPYEQGSKAVAITYLLMGIGSFVSPFIFNNIDMDARGQMWVGAIIFVVLMIILFWVNHKVKPLHQP